MEELIIASFKECILVLTGHTGPMVVETLKLGIAILNGGNTIVQQVMHFQLL